MTSLGKRGKSKYLSTAGPKELAKRSSSGLRHSRQSKGSFVGDNVGREQAPELPIGDVDEGLHLVDHRLRVLSAVASAQAVRLSAEPVVHLSVLHLAQAQGEDKRHSH